MKFTSKNRCTWFDNSRYKVSDIPDWAKSPEILNADRQIKKDVNSEHDGVKVTNVFLLTNNGWIHQKLFGK